MDRIRLALAGCGGRGYGLIRIIADIPDYEIVALCDGYTDKAEKIAAWLNDARGVRPAVYADYREAFEKEKPDAVLIATSWEMHVPVAVDAMRRGIAVAMEVGGAYGEEDCRLLVQTYEETNTPFMFMENCCFNSDELLVTNLVRHGVLGKVGYCHGAYGHDLRHEIAYGDLERHYRLRNYLSRNCENYPTHELGPIAKLLNINRGNRMVSLVSRSSPSYGLSEYVKEKPELSYLKERKFAQGDIVETLITCEGGELIGLRLDTTLPRFYSREFTVRGTKGMYLQDGNMLLTDGGFEEIFAPAKTFEKYLNSAEAYYEKYMPSMWKEASEAVRSGSHGGMDYFEFVAFAECLKEGGEMPIDVYDAAAWMSVTYLSEQSIRGGGCAVPMPDFTNGKYKTRLPKDVIAFEK
ncbi:MAG: Gfo/Idh/MocA family protein [Candidatus Gallimonas sp.]